MNLLVFLSFFRVKLAISVASLPIGLSAELDLSYEMTNKRDSDSEVLATLKYLEFKSRNALLAHCSVS